MQICKGKVFICKNKVMSSIRINMSKKLVIHEHLSTLWQAFAGCFAWKLDYSRLQVVHLGAGSEDIACEASWHYHSQSVPSITSIWFGSPIPVLTSTCASQVVRVWLVFLRSPLIFSATTRFPFGDGTLKKWWKKMKILNCFLVLVSDTG